MPTNPCPDFTTWMLSERRLASTAIGFTQKDDMWVGFLPGGLFLVCGLFTAIPAEKAAKEARELKIQKAAHEASKRQT